MNPRRGQITARCEYGECDHCAGYIETQIGAMNANCMCGCHAKGGSE